METNPSHGCSGAAAAAPSKPFAKPSRHRSIQKKPHTEPKKLQRRVRHSFESGRPDHIDIAGANGRGATSGAHFAARGNADPVGFFYTAASDNPPLDASSYNPTLRHPSKRNGHHLQRIKGNKRRKNADDAEREAELKAMSKETIYYHSKNFTPLRPAAEEWTAGRPLKKDTFKTHHSFSGRHGRNKRHSDVSIPAAESIDSAMSSDSEQIAYTVSPFSALAPKPTLRYATQHYSGPPSGGLMTRRQPSQRRKMAQPIPEAVLKAHKRVDDLADNLDASDLRELMERDQRRRERRRLREQERAQQRLRQAERQRDHPDEDYAESSTPANLARGMLGRETADFGADNTSAVVTSSTRRESPQRPISPPASPGLHPPLDSDASAISVIEEHGSGASMSTHERSMRISRRRSPVEVFYRPDSSPPPPASDFEAGPSSTKTGENMSGTPPLPVLPERTNSKLRKLVKLRRRLSAGSSLQDPERVSKIGRSSSRKTSDTSSFRGAFSWGALGSIFRRSHKGKHGSGPSSFSNLSRDSMAAGQTGPRSQAQVHFHWQQQSQSNSLLVIQTHPPVAASSTPEKQHGAHPFKVQSGVPQRTLSRFREDLPDFLMSPPRSREPSAEAEAVPPVPKPVSVATMPQTQYFDEEEEEGQEDEEEEHDISSTVVQVTQETTEEHQGSMRGGKAARESMRDTPTSWLQMDTADPSPEPNQAISLASIDSEGSWLSGRISKRPISGQDSARVLNSLDDVTHKSLRNTGTYRYSRRSWASNETGVSSELATSPVSARFTAASATSEVPMADDEFVLHRAARDSGGASSASSSTFHRESMGEEMQMQMHTASVDEDTARWGAVSQRKTTTVVTAPMSSVRSSEVLMKSFYEGGDDAGSDDMDSSMSQTSPDSSEFKEEEAGLQRATSVNLGKGHVRKISAGSARLLEISPRSSVDTKGHVDSLL